MRGRIILWLALLVVFLAWRAPASLADSILRQVSHNNFALLVPEGSLWSGSAMLAVSDPINSRFSPLMRVDWTWRAKQLLKGRLFWQIGTDGRAPGSVSVGIHGPELEMLRVALPARYALGRIPNAIGRAGWRGDMLLFVQSWHCQWNARCTGDANLQWFGVVSDLFPLRRFGDYQLNAQARDGLIDLRLDTLAGDIRLAAVGKLDPAGHIEVSGTIVGEPAFVGRLPNIAGKFVTPDGDAGHLRFGFKN